MSLWVWRAQNGVHTQCKWINMSCRGVRKETQTSQISARSAEPPPAVLAVLFHMAPTIWDANRIGARGLHWSLSLLPQPAESVSVWTRKRLRPAPHIHISVFSPSPG